MHPVSTTARGAVLAACLLLALPVAGQEAPPEAPAPPPVQLSVAVVPAHVDPAFEEIAEGYAEFVRQQLSRVGISVKPGDATRRAMAAAPAAKDAKKDAPATSGTALGARPELDRVRQTGADLALLLDLRSGRGVVELDLRVYAIGAPAGAGTPLVGGALGVGTLSTLAATTNPLVLQILPSLGSEAPLQPPSEGLPDAEQLASASRALALIDARELTDAWRELEGMESPFVSALREQIDQAAEAPGVTLAQRARLLIAQGRVAAGWRLVFERAQASLSSGSTDAELLVAAGEAQLAQGNARGAVGYFEKGVAVAPASVTASMGLARAYEAANRPQDARELYERAAELAPTRVEPLEQLASLPSSSPEQQARYLFEAGQRSSLQLRSRQARVDLERAVRLDPSLAPVANDAEADLHLRLGEHDQAIEAWEKAIESDAPTPDRLRGVARARRAMRDEPGAEAAYLEVLELDHDDVGALQDLGDLYTEAGDPAMAIVRLERAQSLAPTSPGVERSLARALQKRGAPGDLARALELHQDANQRAEPGASDLESLAEVHQALGQTDQAVAALERTLMKRHLSMYANQKLAEAYRARGDEEAAESRMQLVRLVSGQASDAASPNGPSGPEAERFEALLTSFVDPSSYGQRVAFLGLRRPTQWRDRLVEWLHPRAPNIPAIEGGILQAISRSHQLVGVPVGALETMGGSLDALFDFDADVSRSADLISFANLSAETDAIFLGRVLHPLGSMGAVDACGPDPYYVLELRKLSGTAEGQISVLANRACVAASAEDGYSVWNWKASFGLGVLLLLLMRPVIRGWGRVRVTVRTPANGRALFSITISRRPKKFKEDKKDSAAPSWRFEKRLKTVGGARRLKGNAMTFSIVAARRKPYYVTVRGPLLDLGTDKLIGEFLEEKTVRVRPWRTNEVKFDMRTERTAITVKPKMSGVEELQARVALRGDPQSLRFTANGEAYLYADPGDHVVVVGAADRVVEIPVRIDSPAPVQLEVDLNDFDNQLFSGCEAAVAPYLEGDFARACEALEAAGEHRAAQRVRALYLQKQGDSEAAARVLESAGMHAASVELRSGSARVSDGPSPDLLEKAGEHRRAAEAYEQQGDFTAAARNFEQAYDYQRAADCYAEIGDTEKVISMLESLGDVYEAGKAAAEAGQTERAIHNLQQVDARHGFYSETCRLLAELLLQRGELDLAVAKYGEAMEIWGDGAPLEIQQAYAELLEQADRQQEALGIYEAIRRRDVTFGDVATRIETLKKKLSTVYPSAADESTATLVSGAPGARIGDANSRYEILEELGRGGMGVVFRARDRNLGRVVALKVLPDNLRQHPQAVKLFLREARAAAALNHPNIVTLFDAGQEGDSYFITMECLDGAGLDQVLASKGTLSTKAVATVGLQVAAGLDYAQRAKIVHRDIKPSNLFLTRDRTVKIMDFGLAKMVEEVRRGSTVIGGTPNFMAPEQATGGDVDHRTDLYALGGTLFQLLTGTVPFEAGDVAYHHVHTPPPDARERNVDVPAAMAELLMRMMAKQPEDRVQSARELATALQAILKSGV